MKIDGIVVLYHPEKSILENIHSYVNELEVLYIIDNSESKNNDLILELKKINKCQYIDNEGNKGIANALNVGAKKAIGNRADWLLTMDQDSKFKDGDLSYMINILDKDNEKENIAICSPMHLEKELDNYKEFYDYITMTSGNLVNLEIFQKLHGFEEKLFIDCVDTDYCLKMKQYNYKLKRLKNIVLQHNLGEQKRLGNFTYTQHNYIRKYYMTRNRLYLWRKHKDVYLDYIRFEQLITFLEIGKVILLEDDKFKKLKMLYKGYRDYKKNRFGKLIEKKGNRE